VTVHRYIIDNTIEDRCVWHRLSLREPERLMSVITTASSPSRRARPP
jgi:hypothetical protein